jgi:hypothetical protein
MCRAAFYRSYRRWILAPSKTWSQSHSFRASRPRIVPRDTLAQNWVTLSSD